MKRLHKVEVVQVVIVVVQVVIVVIQVVIVVIKVVIVVIIVILVVTKKLFNCIVLLIKLNKVKLR